MGLFEYVGEVVTKVDILGTGAIIPVFGLILGISLAASNGRQRNFIYIMIILNLVFGGVLFSLTKEAIYFTGTGIALLISVYIPNNTVESLFGRYKEN